METINGEWVMKGSDENTELVLRSSADALALIQSIGFLPLFSNAIPGFSVEEHVPAACWWTGDPQTDPWEWRIVLARDERIAYGKFFNKAAGFISREFFPVFANYRRDGYDFDALYDDELAPRRSKLIMDALEPDEEAVGKALLSTELKTAAGFGKDGEKNFPGFLTQLQMQTYLIVSDFRQKRNRRGQSYGWHLGLIETPETKWGRAFVTSAYSEDPAASWERIVQRVKKHFPEAAEKDIRTLLGIRYPGTAAAPMVEKKPKKESKPKKLRPAQLPWPENLMTEIGLNLVFPDTLVYEELTPDQMDGLALVLNQLRDREQKMLRMRYEEHQKVREIADYYGLSMGRIQQILSLAIRKLRHPSRLCCYRDGKQGSKAKTDRRKALIKAEQDSEKKLAMLREISLKEYGFLDSGYYWRRNIHNLADLAMKVEQDPMAFLEEHVQLTTLADIIALMEEYGVNCDKARAAYEFSIHQPPKHVSELDISVRLYSILARSGLTQIADLKQLVQTDPDRVLKLRGLGKTMREELFRTLEETGVDCSAVRDAAMKK